MARWHGYIVVQRTTANLNEANWVMLIEAIRAIEIDNGAAQYLLQGRGDLDTFSYEGNIYSNTYIWEARFAPGSVKFEKFKNRLVAVFGVEAEDVTYTTGTIIIRDNLSCFANYFYNGNRRIIIGLFGCADDETLSSWKQSRTECAGYLVDNYSEWEREN